MTTIGSTFLPGVRSTDELTEAKKAAGSDLGQKDFLTLMTTQLQNQDPFAPMQNGEFLAQMAQFSTVAGLDTINETLQSFGAQMGGDRVSRAATMIGRQILVTGTTARPDTRGEIHGKISLDTPAEALSVTFSDASTGQPLHTMDLGPQRAGPVSFAWTDLPASLRESNSAVKLAVNAQQNGQSRVLTPSVYAEVTGVELPETGDVFDLTVQDYGIRNSLEISALR